MLKLLLLLLHVCVEVRKFRTIWKITMTVAISRSPSFFFCHFFFTSFVWAFNEMHFILHEIVQKMPKIIQNYGIRLAANFNMWLQKDWRWESSGSKKKKKTKDKFFGSNVCKNVCTFPNISFVKLPKGSATLVHE